MRFLSPHRFGVQALWAGFLLLSAAGGLGVWALAATLLPMPAAGVAAVAGVLGVRGLAVALSLPVVALAAMVDRLAVVARGLGVRGLAVAFMLLLALRAAAVVGGLGRRVLAAAFLLLPVVAPAAVIDRVAVVVGKTVITESEIGDNLRVTEFLNGDALDLSAAKRREAADRLIDQELLRNEMQITHFAMPAAAEADAQLQQLLKRRFPAAGAYHADLQRYGITEAQLKEQLAWQLAVVRFTDFRFRTEVMPATQSADRASPDTNHAINPSRTAAPPPPQSVDQQLESWLKEQRTNTRVVLKQEAFQ